MPATRNGDSRNASVVDFTLEELIRMRDRDAQIRDCIVAHTSSHLAAFHRPIHIDAFVIGVVTRGSITFSHNMQECSLSRGMMFVMGPHSLVQIISEESFNAHVVIVSSGLFRRLNVDTKRLMPAFLRLGSAPWLELDPEQSETLCNSISMIERELREPENDFSRDILCSLICVLLYKVGAIANARIGVLPDARPGVHNRAREYFRRFIGLLGEYFRSERSVGFYAQQLCVTPKYLTTLIRRISGKSVSEWIDIYVIMEAKMQLRYSDRSVQEIAYLLNFPNQSFFGSYFRRLTGQSPSQFRNDEA